VAHETLPDRRAAWLVTRYEDVARVLKDDTFAKDKLNAMDPEQRAKTPWVPGFLKPLERNMLDLDDPDHATTPFFAFCPSTPNDPRMRTKSRQAVSAVDLDLARGRLITSSDVQVFFVWQPFKTGRLAEEERGKRDPKGEGRRRWTRIREERRLRKSARLPRRCRAATYRR
jgi:hypothetical protein